MTLRLLTASRVGQRRPGLRGSNRGRAFLEDVGVLVFPPESFLKEDQSSILTYSHLVKNVIRIHHHRSVLFWLKILLLARRYEVVALLFDSGILQLRQHPAA